MNITEQNDTSCARRVRWDESRRDHFQHCWTQRKSCNNFALSVAQHNELRCSSLPRYSSLNSEKTVGTSRKYRAMKHDENKMSRTASQRSQDVYESDYFFPLSSSHALFWEYSPKTFFLVSSHDVGEGVSPSMTSAVRIEAEKEQSKKVHRRKATREQFFSFSSIAFVITMLLSLLCENVKETRDFIKIHEWSSTNEHKRVRMVHNFLLNTQFAPPYSSFLIANRNPHSISAIIERLKWKQQPNEDFQLTEISFSLSLSFLDEIQQSSNLLNGWWPSTTERLSSALCRCWRCAFPLSQPAAIDTD